MASADAKAGTRTDIGLTVPPWVLQDLVSCVDDDSAPPWAGSIVVGADGVHEDRLSPCPSDDSGAPGWCVIRCGRTWVAV